MLRKQEKSDLTGLIKWNFQKVTFFLVTLYICGEKGYLFILIQFRKLIIVLNFLV